MKKATPYMKRTDEVDKNIDTEGDFFPTYHSITRRLLQNYKFQKISTFLEPCAGAGDISKVLKEFGYNNILEYDINPRRAGIHEEDFLKIDPVKLAKLYSIDNIITNPPFKLSLEFMQQSAKIANKNIIMLWPLDYIHGADRYENIFLNGINGFRLKYLMPFVRKPNFNKRFKAMSKYSTGMKSFAWFIFERGFNGPITTEILDNRDDVGTPIQADELLFKGIE